MVSIMENHPHTTQEALHGSQSHDKMPGLTVFALTDENSRIARLVPTALTSPKCQVLYLRLLSN